MIGNGGIESIKGCNNFYQKITLKPISKNQIIMAITFRHKNTYIESGFIKLIRLRLCL